MSDLPFGHRQTPPADAFRPPSYGVTGAVRAWPVSLDRQLGIPPLMLFGPLAVIAVLNLLPLVLLSKLPLLDALLHTGTGVIFAAMAAGAALLCVATRSRGRLTVDRQGIDVRTRSAHAFYDWGDVEHLDEMKNAVKVSLKGRSADQNQYNLINARFAGSAGELRQLLSEGLATFGTGRNPGGRSLAPGDDLRRARIRSAKLMLPLVFVPMLAVVVPVAIWQTQECLKGLELKKDGRRATATVTRFYNECGRSRCSTHAEFGYVGPDGRTYTGHGFVASGDHRADDPDLTSAKATGTVPIAYDPARPQVAELNFNDRVFRGDPVKLALSLMGIIGGMMGGITALYLAALAPSLIRAFRTPSGPS